MPNTNSHLNAWDIFSGGSPLPLLDEAEAMTISEKTHATKDYWTIREIIPNHPIKFHTLGGASYLDTSNEIYNQRIQASANKMYQVFGDLYEKLCDKMSEALQTPCVIAKQLAPPGFHIYQGNPLSGVGLAYGGKIHCDMPHLNHADKFDSIDSVLSFTLPVCMPNGGTGMYYWNPPNPQNSQNHRDIYGFAFEKTPEQYQWLEQHKKQVNYQLGNLVMHDGTTPHQLANLCPSTYDDWRITLQGHGILNGGQWHLYF